MKKLCLIIMFLSTMLIHGQDVPFSIPVGQNYKPVAVMYGYIAGADTILVPLLIDSLGALAINSLLDSIVYAEDIAHVTGDEGAFILAIRNDAGTALAADGDYSGLSVNDVGALNANTQEIGGVAPNLGEGVIATGTQRFTIATDDSVVTYLQEIKTILVRGKAASRLSADDNEPVAGYSATFSKEE